MSRLRRIRAGSHWCAWEMLHFHAHGQILYVRQFGHRSAFLHGTGGASGDAPTGRLIEGSSLELCHNKRCRHRIRGADRILDRH